MLHARGLTLTELMVTLGIISVLATQAGPLFIDYPQKLRFTRAIGKITQPLQQARSLALSSGSDVSAIVHGGQTWCIGLTDSNHCNCETTDCRIGHQIFQTLPASQDPAIALHQGATKIAITFSGRNGTAFGSAQTLKVSDAQREAHIVVSALGRTRVCMARGYLSGVHPC